MRETKRERQRERERYTECHRGTQTIGIDKLHQIEMEYRLRTCGLRQSFRA